MKKGIALFCMLALLLSLALPAGAEIVGYADDGWEYIHRYTAPNGQELFFVSSEQEPPIEFEDVNLDGTDDIVAVTAIGASNYYAAFFVWDGEKYVRALHDGNGLSNYSVTPSGYVVSRGSSGWAGALFERRVYAWEGTNLRLVRRMVSEQEETTVYGENSYTVFWDENALRVSLWAYEMDGEEEAVETLRWETRLTLEDLNESPDLFDEFEARLWEGLTP